MAFDCQETSQVQILFLLLGHHSMLKASFTDLLKVLWMTDVEQSSSDS